MSEPVSRINTFMEEDNSPVTIDLVSKIFITAGLLFGINRDVLIGIMKKSFKTWILCYSLLFNVTIIYLWVEPLENVLFWVFVLIPDIFKILVIFFLGFFLRRRLLNFYKKINMLDKDAGYKISSFDIGGTAYNIIQMIMIIMFDLISHLYETKHQNNPAKLLSVLFRKMIICIELHFYGHLLSIMFHRLKLFTRHLRFSYPDNREILPYEDTTQAEDVQTASHMDMKKFMDLYNQIIITHESLVEATKWQVLGVLMMTFVLTLQAIFYFFKISLKENWSFSTDVIPNFSNLFMEFMPLLLICVFADRISEEVRLISDILNCRLYENRSLNKSDRSTARALLALTKKRKLSFSLFHMFDIDMSLPFKYLGFLLTYLVILLQFDKVLSPKFTITSTR